MDIREHVEDWLVADPDRAISLGSGLLRLGGGLLLVGLVGHLGTQAVAVVQAQAGQRPAQMLAEWLPSIPVWWVPESLAAFLLVGLVAGVGGLLVLEGRRLKRFLEA